MSQSSPEISIDEALAKARAPKAALADDIYLTLGTLEFHECWGAWFDLVKARIKVGGQNKIDDFVHMIRVHISYLDDVEAAGAVCKDLVLSEKMSYASFRENVLDKTLESEQYKTESVLLGGVYESFSQRDDKIAAIERLCFIFEKKAHNEKLLHQFYERLRKMHPENQKALRYFRNLYSQLQDWPAVIEVLKKLLSSAKHKQESFRHAQELAAVYLYQLGDCQEAIHYIEEYCTGSPLDTSTIHYEAYYRLGNLEGCLRVLRSALLVVDDQATKSVVYFRMASIFEQLGQFQLAYDHFQKALELNDEFMEAIEGLISSSIKLKNWQVVRDWLNVLAGRTRSNNLIGQLRAGIQRLEEGLANAAANR
jgi:tetratricopeptide (TPR) repeat protein